MPSILIAAFAFVMERPVPGLFWENETEQVNRRNSTTNIEDRLIMGLRAANLEKVRSQLHLITPIIHFYR